MKRKNFTRNALVTSILSLLLCVTMLVGTTFAWFTDEVVSGRNTIAAGNLDIELLANGKNVDSSTVLFSNEQLWEPGVVVYENLQIANVGTLALKYQLTLDVFAENDLNGHKLSEVVKLAVIDKVADNATRAEVLAAAKASAAQTNGLGTLANFQMTGSLKAGETSAEQTVVIYWEPNDNAKDNLYNANNGQKTSDGKPLFIEFGVNLQATQLMHEEDTFGPDYDGAASFLPKATVNNQGTKTIEATHGINGAVNAYEAPFVLQFLPNETAEEGEASEYALWHADFVVKADRDVKADSMALAGYYDAWCQYNDDNWVAMINDDTDIAAGQEIRLVELLEATVNYKEICYYGNDPEDTLPPELEGFLATAIDLTGENTGTTITVELRLYKVPAKGECAIGGGCTHPKTDCETGEYEVAGVYTYTFGTNSADDLLNALNAGVPNIVLENDIELNDAPLTIPAGSKTVINLNGHTITGTSTSSTTSNLIKVPAGAELTLTGNGMINFAATKPDTEWGGEGQPAFPGYANNTISNLGKLTIDGVTIKNATAPGGASYAIDCYQGSELIVNDGVIDGMGKCAIRMFCNSNTLSTNVTINGGTITGKRAIWVQLPGSNIANVRPVNLTINGGELICTNTDADVCVYSYSYGDSFANTNITITGGEFTGLVAFGGGNAKSTQEKVTITGGTFNDGVGRYLANDGWEDITV